MKPIINSTDAALEYHDISNILPLIEGAELQGLAADLKKQGLVEPIVLYEGKILDGRNRYRACQMAGVKPHYEEFKGTPEEAISRVWSLNVPRRHLSKDQIACADALRNKLLNSYAEVREAAKLRELRGRGADGSGGRGNKKNPEIQIPQGLEQPPTKTLEVRARAVGANSTYIYLADKLLKEEPEVFKQVQTGKKRLSQIRFEKRVARASTPSKRPKHTPAYNSANNAQKRFREKHYSYIDACVTACRKKGGPISMTEIAAATGLSKHNIENNSIEQYWALVPWLELDSPSPGKFSFKINRYLRAVCKERGPGPSADKKAIIMAIDDLRQMIDHDRQEAKASRDASKWNPLTVRASEVMHLMDRIEDGLDKMREL